jgi:hypothetical protein
MQQQPPSGALSDFRDWMSQLLQGAGGVTTTTMTIITSQAQMLPFS